MKAIVLNAFGSVTNFTLAELPLPVPGAAEVLIELKASAFNPIDYQMRKGLRESKLMRSPVLGRECSGIVVQTGAEVEGFFPGDEVIVMSGSRGSNGSYAAFMTLDYHFIAHKPANISFEMAAAIPASGTTAWQAFTRMACQTDSRIFINGAAGGVGRFLISLLLAQGFNRIVASAGSEESRAVLKRIGLQAEQIVDYRDPGFEKLILKANDDQYFDYSVDLVGGRQSEIAADVLKVNGTYVDITFLATEAARATLFDKGCVVLNISGYAYAMENNMSWYGNTLTKICNLIEEGRILAPEINILGGLNVETVQMAHRLMEANQIYGKKLIMCIDRI